jgi:hypothetical protein
MFLLIGCPKPEPEWEGDQCTKCHAGIESIHPDWPDNNCVPCHGGNGQTDDKALAHVPVPDNYWDLRAGDSTPVNEGYIHDFTAAQLDALDPVYLQFRNPSDHRVNEVTCGRCHPVEVETQRNSIMTTNAGHYLPSRYYAGMQEQDALFGAHAAVDPGYTGEPGTVASLERMVAPSADDDRPAEFVAMDHYLSKSCSHCHAASYGKNNSRGLYRSSGCASCHMPYGMDGVYEGGDTMIADNVPVHPKRHQLTAAVPTEQCAACHFQGGRIGLLFRGIREGGFSDAPPNAEPWDEAVYGHTAGYYFLDEDTTNSVDETPPDAHYAAGMHCADCHVGTDVHGDGRIHSTSKTQVDISCEDCHGTVREAARPDDAGVFRTRGKSRELSQLSMEGTEVVLTGKVDGARHVVPQPAELLADGGSGTERMHASMGVDTEGWSHTDDVSCISCHSGWQQMCIGCHVTVDYRLDQKDYQTGEVGAGLARGSRDTYTLDHLLLAQGVDGKAWTTQPSQHVQMTVIDESGAVLVDAAFRTREGIAYQKGFAPFFQHTTTANARGCADCHRTDDTPEEWARVRGVYGHGTGEFGLEDGETGVIVDPLQFLDADGNQTTSFVHPGTGPLPEASRTRALSVVAP